MSSITDIKRHVPIKVFHNFMIKCLRRNTIIPRKFLQFPQRIPPPSSHGSILNFCEIYTWKILPSTNISNQEITFMIVGTISWFFDEFSSHFSNSYAAPCRIQPLTFQCTNIRSFASNLLFRIYHFARNSSVLFARKWKITLLAARE